jgi:hypothetical protein
MDPDLARVLGELEAKEEAGLIRTETETDGTWLYMQRGATESRIALKPLLQLLCAGDHVHAVDPDDDRHLNILMGIEMTILQHYRDNPCLTDADVLRTLDRMAQFLGRDGQRVVGHLGQVIETRLRMVLSIADYSFRDVRKLLRYILRSVERHRKWNGANGYLEFIEAQLGAIDFNGKVAVS